MVDQRRVMLMGVEKGESGSVSVARRQYGELFSQKLLLQRRLCRIEEGESLSETGKIISARVRWLNSELNLGLNSVAGIALIGQKA